MILQETVPAFAHLEESRLQHIGSRIKIVADSANGLPAFGQGSAVYKIIGIFPAAFMGRSKIIPFHPGICVLLVVLPAEIIPEIVNLLPAP